VLIGSGLVRHALGGNADVPKGWMTSVIEPLLWGLGFGICAIVMLGLRRIPWRYALVSASGTGLVLALLPGWPGMPIGVAVLLAAIGGSVASLAFERGERNREHRVAEILRGSAPRG
jgi:hypothetical protein